MANIKLKDLLTTHLYQLIPNGVICKVKVCQDYFSYCEPEDFDKLETFAKANEVISLGNFQSTGISKYIQWSLFPEGKLTNWIFPVYNEGIRCFAKVFELDISDWLKQQPDSLLTRIAAIAFHVYQTEEDNYKTKFNSELLSFMPKMDVERYMRYKARSQKSEEKFYRNLEKEHLIWA